MRWIFETGFIRRGIQFFKPRVDGTCKISNTGRDPDNEGEDDFTCYRRLRELGINEDLGLQVDVAYAFRDYALDLARCYRFDEDWTDISESSPHKGRFGTSTKSPHNYYVIRGSQVTGTRQSHRKVWMVCHDETDRNWPSISELIVLVSWMIAGMKSQKGRTSSRPTKRDIPFHHTFPTLVISSEPRARARVLYGYFDGGLKVLFSKAQEFDNPSYVRTMNTPLQWAWPHTCLSTTRLRPLPTVLEESKENNGKHGIHVGAVSKKRGICHLKSKILPFIRKKRSNFHWVKKVTSKLKGT